MYSPIIGNCKMLRLHNMLQGDTRHLCRNDEFRPAQGCRFYAIRALELLHKHWLQCAIHLYSSTSRNAATE